MASGRAPFDSAARGAEPPAVRPVGLAAEIEFTALARFAVHRLRLSVAVLIQILAILPQCS